MSVADQITRLNTAKNDIRTAIQGKGVTVPSAAKLDTYNTYINSIVAMRDNVITCAKYLCTNNRFLGQTNMLSDFTYNLGTNGDLEGMFESCRREYQMLYATIYNCNFYSSLTATSINLKNYLKNFYDTGTGLLTGIFDFSDFTASNITNMESFAEGLNAAEKFSLKGLATVTNCNNWKNAFKNANKLDAYSTEAYTIQLKSGNNDLSNIFYGTTIKNQDKWVIFNGNSSNPTDYVIYLPTTKFGDNWGELFLLYNSNFQKVKFSNLKIKYDERYTSQTNDKGSFKDHFLPMYPTNIIFDHVSITNGNYQNMFSFKVDLQTITGLETITFTNASSNGFQGAFAGCTKLSGELDCTTLFAAQPNTAASSASLGYRSQNMFSECTSLTSIKGINAGFIGRGNYNYFGAKNLPNITNVEFNPNVAWSTQSYDRTVDFSKLTGLNPANLITSLPTNNTGKVITIKFASAVYNALTAEQLSTLSSKNITPST